MAYSYRPATDAEIIADKANYLDRGWMVKFRHFTVESTDNRTETGVRHRQYSRAKLRVIDGVPYVKHHGRMHRLTDTVLINSDEPDRKPLLFDLRLVSKYLNGVDL